LLLPTALLLSPLLLLLLLLLLLQDGLPSGAPPLQLDAGGDAAP
jgi:hypothetical protein